MMSPGPEFSRPFDTRSLPSEPIDLNAGRDERVALAERFGLVALEELSARVSLSVEGSMIAVSGRMLARFVQSCAVSGEDLATSIDEQVALRFIVETSLDESEEIVLVAGEPDEIVYSGTLIDLGEALAQSLALAIDPYACGPDAEQARALAGLSTPEQVGPFAALAALKTRRG